MLEADNAYRDRGAGLRQWVNRGPVQCARSLYGIQDVQELNALFMTLAYNTAQEVSPVAGDDEEMGPVAETAVFAQWFRSDLDLHYARWKNGAVDIRTVLDAHADALPTSASTA